MDNVKLSLDEKTMNILGELIDIYSTQTFKIEYRGPRGQFSSDNAVPALITIGRGKSSVCCPRFQTTMDYIAPSSLKERTSANMYCYAGGEEKVPLVSEDNFAMFGIFECPYKI